MHLTDGQEVDITDEGCALLSLYEDDEMEILESKDQIEGDVTALEWRPFQFGNEQNTISWNSIAVPNISVTPPSPVHNNFPMELATINEEDEEDENDEPPPAKPVAPVSPRKKPVLDSILCTPRLNICTDLTGIDPFGAFRTRRRYNFTEKPSAPKEDDILNAVWMKKWSQKAMAKSPSNDDDILSRDIDIPLDDDDEDARPPTPYQGHLKRLQNPSRQMLNLIAKLAVKRLNRQRGGK